jgi:hypothetical protein
MLRRPRSAFCVPALEWVASVRDDRVGGARPERDPRVAGSFSGLRAVGRIAEEEDEA